MTKIKQVWQLLNTLLNTDIRELGKPGEIAEAGAEVSKAGLELAIALGLLGTPAAPLAVIPAGLSFVGLARKGVNLYRDKAKGTTKLEEWAAIAFPLAYLESFDILVRENDWLQQKIGSGISNQAAKSQLDQLGELQLYQKLIEDALTYFPESRLGQALNQQLSEYLNQAGLNQYSIPIVTGWVAWGIYPIIDQLLSYESETITQPLQLTRTAARETQASQKYGSIESYLTEQISPHTNNPLLQSQWKVLGENFTLPDIYVPLEAHLVDKNGKVDKQANPVNLEQWAKEQLTNPDKNGQILFIQAGPGRGKSVFCRMFANWVREHFHPIWTPILIRLRDIDAFENNIENTLRAAVKADFVKSDDGWLTDRNTRFLFVLDGFDELRMEGRTTGGIEKFLKQVGNFQTICQNNPQLGHRFLVTGRELALHGIERFLPGNLERVEIALMNDQLQQQWLGKWSNLVGQDNAKAFREFLQAGNCPERVKELAREPLLLYLLAAMHRDGEISLEMFEGTSRAGAKVLIYQKALDWVLTQQRSQELNLELTEQETDDLRRILTEAGLCVTQSGGEWTSIGMIEERLKGDDQARKLLEKARERIGDNPLRNALAAFYLRPASASEATEGAVEFVHKSFAEFLCAQRLVESLKEWVEPRRKRGGFLVSQDQLAEEVYDLLGYGGLTWEIVEYMMVLLDVSQEEFVQLFERLEEFYLDWCNGEFINAEPTSNLPQKKMLQLRKYGSWMGLREVDIYAGINVMILLLALNRYAQNTDELKGKISFNPCGHTDSDSFEPTRLLRIISYSNSVNIDTFKNTVKLFLSGVNLRMANLRRVNLIGAELNGADLSGVNLIGAELNGADLSNINFMAADLSDADLINANLSNANLLGTNLSDANLSDANVSCAKLIRANLSDANLSNANLINANVSNAKLIRANLSDANLINANLINANLINANLRFADLSDANFSNAKLIRANLSNANFSNAKLIGANLSDANFRFAKLDNITWNENTQWENVQGLETAYNMPEALKQLLSLSPPNPPPDAPNS
ncbi:MAG: pentapeptide repeat-containing protein [Coleofasciculus chthonoplastes F3-SA18-01]|uniref:pentapeptide repeat-containing protein n=1 Tax=Coleofasciculus chthonoplastes TaxID=64178 RepID=UPI003304B884